MKKKIKRAIFNVLFNARQREIIWNAVLFSEHTYRRRGNVEGAAAVRTVINEVIEVAGTKQRKFYASEVDKIVEEALNAQKQEFDGQLERAYNKGKEAGYNKATEEFEDAVKDSERHFIERLPKGKGFLAVGSEFDPKKCEACKKKDECLIREAIQEVEQEIAEQKKNDCPEAADAEQVDDSAEEQTAGEQTNKAEETDGTAEPGVSAETEHKDGE